MHQSLIDHVVTEEISVNYCQSILFDKNRASEMCQLFADHLVKEGF